MLPPPPPPRPWWHFPAIVGGVLLSLGLLVLWIAAWGLPAMRVAGQAQLEREAISTLRRIQWAEGRYREETGAWGTIRQLAGADPVDGATLGGSLLPTVGVELHGQVLFHEGYCFRIDVQEDGYGAWAWPHAPGATLVACIGPTGDPVLTPLEAHGCEGGPPPSACGKGAPHPP